MRFHPSNLASMVYSEKTALLFLPVSCIDIKPKKQEIGFVKNSKIFCDVCILKGSLKFWINLKKGQLDDPKQISRDVAAIGHWGNGDYEIMVSNTQNLEYIMSLIKQAL